LIALHGLQGKLAEIESSLIAEDFTKLESILNEAQSRHQALTQ
jgi:hypothetical protein